MKTDKKKGKDIRIEQRQQSTWTCIRFDPKVSSPHYADVSLFKYCGASGASPWATQGRTQAMPQCGTEQLFSLPGGDRTHNQVRLCRFA